MRLPTTLISPARPLISSGFLPVVFSWLRARRQAQPLSLPADSEEEPAVGSKAVTPQAHLHGWKVLLMWFPAACDLTGTTVRRFALSNPALLMPITLPSPACGSSATSVTMHQYS